MSPALLALVAGLAARAEPPVPQPPAAPARVRLAFTGDVSLYMRPIERRTIPWSKNPFRRVAHHFRRADLAVANLEGILTRRNPRVVKKRIYNLWAPSVWATIFREAGIGLVGTANNHAFDGRAPGTLETLRHLRATGVTTIGTGRNAKEARTPFVMRTKGTCVAVVPASTLSNKSVRGKATMAYYPYVRRPTLHEIVRRTRARCAFVVVYIHWGDEYEYLPDKHTRRFAHALIRSGASLVVGHHPHVLQGVEFYRGGAIAYSLGNFVFPAAFLRNRRSGLLWAEVDPEAAKLTRLELVPMMIHRKRWFPEPATPAQQRETTQHLARYSHRFGTQVVLEDGRIRFYPAAAISPP